MTVVKTDGDGALHQAAPAGAVDDQHFAAAAEPPETLPATIDESSDSLANIFETPDFN